MVASLICQGGWFSDFFCGHIPVNTIIEFIIAKRIQIIVILCINVNNKENKELSLGQTLCYVSQIFI